MTRMKLLTVASACAACLLLGACKDLLVPPDGYGPGVIYANSFESPGDTVGWKTLGVFAFDDSAAPGCGLQSIRVSGGCPAPHASLRISAGVVGGKVALRCWGRNLALGGGVDVWRTADPSTRIQVAITDTVWRAYESSASLDCVAGEELEIDMISGGIVYSAMLVDSLRIYRVGAP